MAIITITGLEEVLRRLDDIGKQQLPFAMAKAMTATVKQAQAAETAHIDTAFDRPTSFTKRAIGISTATKNNLAASVFVKAAQAKYLQPEIEGGPRPLKTFEQKFSTEAGQAQVVLPGRGVPLNAYGNITRAKIKRIASDLGTSTGRQRTFVGQPTGHPLPSGVYSRTKQGVTPLLVFAAEAKYQKRFDFTAIATGVITRNFGANMAAAWEETMRAARP